MHKTIMACAAALAFGLTACAQQKENTQGTESPKVLVAYFSATGTTERAARQLAEATGGTLHEIVPAQPYTAADLDWHDAQSRSSKEMADPQSRPALKDAQTDVAAYDVVFIGYPIWWNLAPRAVNTFIETADLTGKVVVPFATSGGSGVANSAKELKAAYPALDWRDGKLLNRTSQADMRKWADSLAE